MSASLEYTLTQIDNRVAAIQDEIKELRREHKLMQEQLIRQQERLKIAFWALSITAGVVGATFDGILVHLGYAS